MPMINSLKHNFHEFQRKKSHALSAQNVAFHLIHPISLDFFRTVDLKHIRACLHSSLLRPHNICILSNVFKESMRHKNKRVRYFSSIFARHQTDSYINHNQVSCANRHIQTQDKDIHDNDTTNSLGLKGRLRYLSLQYVLMMDPHSFFDWILHPFKSFFTNLKLYFWKQRDFILGNLNGLLHKIHEGKVHFDKLVEMQPKNSASKNLPPLYPDGLKVILLTFAFTLLVIYSFQLMLDIIEFSYTVVISIFQSVSSRWLRFWNLVERVKTEYDPVFTRGNNNKASNSNSNEKKKNSAGKLVSFSKRKNFLSPENSTMPTSVREWKSFRAREATDAESAEWINAAAKKIWRLYHEEISSRICQILQEAIDKSLSKERPVFLQSILVQNFVLGNRAAYIRNVQKLPTRQDGDMAFHFDMRYDGDMSVRLLVQLGFQEKMLVRVPVEVGGFDVDAKVWVRARLIENPPYLGDLSMALVRTPHFDLSVRPFTVVNVMELPGLRMFLRNLLSVSIPKSFVLPNKVDIVEIENQETLEKRSERFKDLSSFCEGILSVTLYEASDLKGTTTLGLSNPFCILSVGGEVVRSKADKSTSETGRRGNPVWNQSFELLVRERKSDRLRIEICDRYGIQHRAIGVYETPIMSLEDGAKMDTWVALKESVGSGGRLHLMLHYQSFVETEVVETLSSK